MEKTPNKSMSTREIKFQTILSRFKHFKTIYLQSLKLRGFQIYKYDQNLPAQQRKYYAKPAVKMFPFKTKMH